MYGAKPHPAATLSPASSCSTDLYNISNTRGKVGTFCIFKTVYKIGEDVIGTFNFSEGDIPCLQVSAGFGVTVGRGRGFGWGRGRRDWGGSELLWGF